MLRLQFAVRVVGDVVRKHVATHGGVDHPLADLGVLSILRVRMLLLLDWLSVAKFVLLLRGFLVEDQSSHNLGVLHAL